MAQETVQPKTGFYMPQELKEGILAGDPSIRVLRYMYEGKEDARLVRLNQDGSVVDWNLKAAGIEKNRFTSLGELMRMLGAEYVPGKEGEHALARFDEYVAVKTGQGAQEGREAPGKTGSESGILKRAVKKLAKGTEAVREWAGAQMPAEGEGGQFSGAAYGENEIAGEWRGPGGASWPRSRPAPVGKKAVAKQMERKEPGKEGAAQPHVPAAGRATLPNPAMQAWKREFEEPSEQPLPDAVATMWHFYIEDAKSRKKENKTEATWCSSGVMAIFYAILAEKGLSTNEYHHFGRPYEKQDIEQPSPGYMKVLREPMFEQRPIACAVNFDGGVAGLQARKDLREQLAAAPRGAILTLRYERTATGVEHGITHAMICLGDGKFAHVFGTNYKEVDFSSMGVVENFFIGTGKGPLAREGAFSLPEDSRLYIPHFERFPPAVERTFAVRDVYNEAEDAGKTPETLKLAPVDFARRLSALLNMPFEAIFPEVARQNLPAEFRFAQVVRDMSPDLIVTLRVPTFPGAVPQVAFNPEGNPAREGAGEAGGMAGTSKWWATSKFDSKSLEISGYAKDIGMPPGALASLKTILFNEYYSGFGERVGLDLGYNLAYSLLPNRWVDKIADNVSEWAGHGNALPNSIGIFQVGVNQTIEYLDYLAGRETLPARERAQAGRMRGELLAACGPESGPREAIEGWNPLWGGRRKREIVVGEILSSDRMQTYFAYLRFSLDIQAVQDRAKVEAMSGPGVRVPVPEDVAFTAVFSYNKGMARAQAAVFQQDLCMLAQDSRVNIDLGKFALGGFRIDGTLGQMSAELCREICSRIGMLNGKVAGKTLNEITSDPAVFESVFAEYAAPGSLRAMVKTLPENPLGAPSRFSPALLYEPAAPDKTRQGKRAIIGKRSVEAEGRLEVAEEEGKRQAAARENVREFFRLAARHLDSNHSPADTTGTGVQVETGFERMPCLSREFCSQNRELLTTARQNYFAFTE